MYQAMIFLLVVILFLFGYLSLFNSKEIVLFLSKNTSINTTASAIVIASFILGMFFMAAVSLVREAGKLYREWQHKGQINKESISTSLVEKGNVEILRGSIERAKSFYMDAISKSPANITAHIKLSEAYMLSKDNQNALKLLLKVKYQDPENIQLLNSLYNLYTVLNDTTSMIDTAKKLVSIDEDNTRFLSMLRNAYIASAKVEESYRTQKIIMRLMKGTDAYTGERIKLGELKYDYAMMIYKNGDADLAIKKLGDVKRLNTQFSPAYVSIGDIYINTKNDLEKAIDEWKSGYAETHDAIFLIKMEDVFLQHDNPYEILRIYRKILSEEPEDNLARILFLKLVLRLEMVDEANEQLAYLDNKWIHIPSTEIMMAELMSKKGDYESAFKKLMMLHSKENHINFPYVCSKCGYENFTWSAKCPSCNAPGTMYLKTAEELKSIKINTPNILT